MNQDIIVLIDETGEEIEYELLDVIDYEGSKYYCVILNSEEEEEEVLILSVVVDADTGEDILSEVIDKDLLDKIFDIFEERNIDDFEFMD